MTKHTPGPWTVSVGKKSRIMAREIILAECWDEVYGPETQAESEANAAFIVRACNAHEDLLNACEVALSQLTEDREEYLDSDIQQIKDAIAKARGQE